MEYMLHHIILFDIFLIASRCVKVIAKSTYEVAKIVLSKDGTAAYFSMVVLSIGYICVKDVLYCK